MHAGCKILLSIYLLALMRILNPDSVPSQKCFRKEGFDLITEMLRQILAVHTKATHIHIGKYSNLISVLL